MIIPDYFSCYWEGIPEGGVGRRGKGRYLVVARGKKKIAFPRLSWIPGYFAEG